MLTIQPYDNSKVTGYVATSVLVYIPSKDVSQLAELLHVPNSKLFEQPSESVRSLLANLDPTIPLVGDGISSSNSFSGFGSDGSGSSGTNFKGSQNAANSDNGNNDDDDDDDNGTNSSAPARPTSIGIGVGVVGGAALYGAAMWWVASRYRKNRREHKRASSTVSQVRQNPGAEPIFASGARQGSSSDSGGRNNRTTNMISAPVNAGNSLGWN